MYFPFCSLCLSPLPFLQVRIIHVTCTLNLPLAIIYLQAQIFLHSNL
jgi:hypothetical protein